MTFIIAQILGVMVTIMSVATPHLKKMYLVLIFELGMNFLTAIQYWISGGVSGAYLCLVASLHIVILMLIDEFTATNIRKKKYSISVMFALIYSIIALYTYNSFIDLVPLLSSVLFVISVFQADVKSYTTVMMIKSFTCGIYDISTRAYSSILTRAIQIASGFISIYRLNKADNKNQR